MKRGFTLIEIILAVAIISVIAMIVVSSYSRFNATVSLKSDIGKIVSLLEKAKSDTLSSRGGQQYGVHFESGKAVLFQGDTYSVNAATNVMSPLSPTVTISDIGLIGGGSDIVFQRLTGVTDTPGSVTVRSSGNYVATSVISVSVNGVVTIQ